MSKVYCKSDFKKLEKEFKIQRLKAEGKAPEGKALAGNPVLLQQTKASVMNKIQKALTGLWQVIKNPWLLNHVLDQEQYWRKKVVSQFGFENGLPLLDLDELFPALDETVSPYAFLDGSCLPTDLALLRALARKFKVESYLEIGTWRGESVANVAPLVFEAVTINLPDEEMRALGMNENYIGLHRLFSEKLPNVTHLQANSLSFDFASLRKKFDMIFVDGDHHYEAVRSDSSRVLQALNLDKGILVWHDYARNPELIRWSVLAGILEGLPREMHPHLYHVANTMCAVFLPGLEPEFPRKTLQPNQKPQKYFEVTLRTRPVGS
ncbi:MAG: class I SAM-dependent methyltransferase [Bacteroidales bacterium]|jgi:hypothetical protein|nr:class I SAM-dependent methyltransferase [Bacteroidales bacterium]NLM92124.1 class I SAM-dependent methyltransferase [Bacteroidales bacterium]